MDTILDDGTESYILNQSLVEVVERLEGQKLANYNLFIVGHKKSGKTTLTQTLKEVLNDDQDYNIYELNAFSDDNSNNSLKNEMELVYLINKSPKSLVVIMVHALFVCLNESRRIFDLFDDICSNGIYSAFLIFNQLSTNQECHKKQFINYYNQQRSNLNQLTVQLLDDIIQADKIVYIKKGQQNNHIRRLLDKNIYNQLEINISSGQTSEQLNYQGQIIQKNKERLTEKIIMHKIQSILRGQQVNDTQLQQMLDRLKMNFYYEKLLISLKMLKSQQDNNYFQQLEDINSKFTRITVDQQGDTLRIITTQYSTQELLKLYEQKQLQGQITQIFIYSFAKFQVDCDLKFPSVSIFIYTYEFDVSQDCIIDLSGADGFTYQQKARSGLQGKVIHGECGVDGGSGQNGGSFILNSKITKNFEKVCFKLSGGDGGKGQNGGDGADGEDGQDAEQKEVLLKNQKYIVKQEPISNFIGDVFENFLTFNKTYKITYQSQGTNGVRGGNSGSGGFGGNGGFKGNISVYDYNIRKPNEIIKETRRGTDGVSGIPGRGGKKGRNFEGQSKDVVFFGSFRKSGSPDDFVAKTVATGGAVTLGAKKLTSQAALLFAEEQAAVRTIAGAAGGVLLLAGQTIISGIHIGVSSLEDWITCGYDCNIIYEQNGKVIEKLKLNQDVQKAQRQFKHFMREKKQEFIHFVNSQNRELEKEFPQLNLLKDLLRYDKE